MGLDSTIYIKEKNQLTTDVDFYSQDADKSFAYFRKNSALHSWAHRLYLLKRGTNPEFNGDAVVLLEKDIRDLQVLLEAGVIEGAAGFFWGTMTEDKYDDISSFAENALSFYRDKANVGLILYYNSSW